MSSSDHNYQFKKYVLIRCRCYETVSSPKKVFQFFQPSFTFRPKFCNDKSEMMPQTHTHTQQQQQQQQPIHARLQMSVEVFCFNGFTFWPTCSNIHIFIKKTLATLQTKSSFFPCSPALALQAKSYPYSLKVVRGSKGDRELTVLLCSSEVLMFVFNM